MRNAKIDRTERGTIELISHPTGTSIRPRYNACGILIGIEFSDGSRFAREFGTNNWIATDPNGKFADLNIATIYLDRAGNVSYSLQNGHSVTIMNDGSVANQY